jgi:pimeloyl-ACP methyl ester carboxylesterase
MPDVTMAQSAVSKQKPADPPVIVVGFVGGWVHYDNLVHSEVQLATKLRAAYPAGVYARTFENHKSNQAYREIVRLLDRDRDGSLSPNEKQDARIILYGHSWGGSEAVRLADRLQKKGIPVLLTVQVDSIEKLGENDAVIPPNVEEAANFYQPHGMLHGRSSIRAADPERTKILGNFRFDYADRPLACGGYSWWDRYIAKQHTQIECDPAVWARVEELIRKTIKGQPVPRQFASGN